MYHDFDIGCGVVLDLANLEFAFFIGFQDAVDHRSRGLTVGNVGDDQGLFVKFLDFGANPDFTPAFAGVVIFDIDHAARREVGIKLKRPTFEISDARLDQFAEVVRQNFRAQTDCNPLHALCQDKRKLHRQRDRLVFAAIIAQLPIGGFGVECDL